MGAAPSFSSFAPGSKILDRYIVEEMIGVGGMGMVFRATHELLGETVAIKCLRTEQGNGDELLARFLREARASAQIKSQHVARVHDVGTLPSGTPYMVMEYLAGEDLSVLLDRVGALPAHDAIEYMLQACDALVAAHKLGLVHRDIKPGNFFLTANEHDEKVIKMLDFGISKAEGENLTQSAVMLGTPYYMAPEQLYSAKAADARSDIWSMGVVLYELIEGTRPFTGDSVFELGGSILTNPPHPPKRAWPPGLYALVEKCLSKAPEQRFQSAHELLAALLPFDQDLGKDRHARSRRGKLGAAQQAVPVSQVPPAPSVPPVPPASPMPHASPAASSMALDKTDVISMDTLVPSSTSREVSPPLFETLVVARSEFPVARIRKVPYRLIGLVVAGIAAVAVFLFTRGDAPPARQGAVVAPEDAATNAVPSPEARPQPAVVPAEVPAPRVDIQPPEAVEVARPQVGVAKPRPTQPRRPWRGKQPAPPKDPAKPPQPKDPLARR